MPEHGDLHEISLAIGNLQAEATSSREGRQVLHAKLDKINAGIAELNVQLANMNGSIGQLQQEMAEVKPEVSTWRALRNRAIGGMLALSLIMATGGAAAWHGLQKAAAAYFGPE